MEFDLIVIGSGPGGYVAAIRASQLGMKTAVVERSELGGICLNWGCIPTKALLKSAQAYHYAVSGETYGFKADNVTADLESIVTRSREVSETMNKGITFLFKKNNVTVIEGTGSITADKKVSVSSLDGTCTVYDTKNIIIATGARPVSLPFAPVDGDKIWCYRQALTPDKLPASMVVIGSGAIGTEFAFFYRTLGTDVTIVEYVDRILPVEDDDTSAQVSRSLRKAGIKVMTSAAVKSVEKGDLCKVEVETKKGTEYLEAEVVLSAVGVVPNTENIGLEALGIELNRGRIAVDAHYKTAVDGIYAIGDVIATPALAHVASAEAVHCVEHIAGLNPEPVNYSYIPGCTYISPEVASAGMTERAAKEKGLEYKTAKFPFTASGKATAAGEKDGFVKIISDVLTDKVLGVHLVGANVSEMIGPMVALMKNGITAAQLAKTIFPHPTMSEGIMEAAAAIHSEAIHF
ncbi:MAG: dihydrolipoyl dehydrogenase [Bacteroidales bacterium]|nr:dihydrolipoyl dehydrogenase [Bacteroidales bacterium]